MRRRVRYNMRRRDGYTNGGDLAKSWNSQELCAAPLTGSLRSQAGRHASARQMAGHPVVPPAIAPHNSWGSHHVSEWHGRVGVKGTGDCMEGTAQCVAVGSGAKGDAHRIWQHISRIGGERIAGHHRQSAVLAEMRDEIAAIPVRW
jgi:hypothetical protein